MKELERDKILMEVHKNVGETLGIAKSNRYRIQELETSKVSWKAFTSIGSIVVAMALGVSKFIFERGQ